MAKFVTNIDVFIDEGMALMGPTIVERRNNVVRHETGCNEPVCSSISLYLRPLLLIAFIRLTCYNGLLKLQSYETNRQRRLYAGCS